MIVGLLYEWTLENLCAIYNPSRVLLFNGTELYPSNECHRAILTLSTFVKLPAFILTCLSLALQQSRDNFLPNENETQNGSVTS